jgi:hypothetical protein
MGVVYRAQDRETGQPVALKVLRPEVASDTASVERLKKELLLARQVTHKNVCRVYEFNRTGDVAFISMELVQGETLRSVLSRFGPLSIRKGIEIARQMCAGLREAHAQGIVHRDLKPQNIMVDTGGVIKIMDFGIARSVSADTTLTIAGTPAYMAPEQAEGKPADHRSDIYSLGLILYEMFTGTLAFNDASAFARLARSSHDGPTPPREVEPNVPEWLEAAIQKCLEKEPEKRFESVNELDILLCERLSEKLPSPSTAPAHRMFHFSRLASVIAGVVAVLAFVVGFLAGHYWQLGPAPMHHDKPVYSVAFGQGGKLLASASEDHTIKIWAIPSERQLRRLTGHTGAVNSVAFSPDGGLLASGSTDKTVKVWNVSTWTAEHTLRGHTAQVTSVAFSRDGRLLASGSDDGTVKVWDVKAGKELLSLKAHEVGVTAVAFSGDAKILASCDTDGKIKLRDPATGRETGIFADSDEVHAIAFSPDSQQLASGGLNRIIKLWDVATGRPNDLEGHTDTVYAVAFSPDGRWLISGSDDETIRLWDVATGKQTRILAQNTGGVSDLSISSKDGYLGGGNGSGDVRLLQVKELR